MQAPSARLELSLAAFRREQALAYVRALADPDAPQGRRALANSDELLSLLDEARRADGLSPGTHAAALAHLMRAQAERAYADARRQSAVLAGRELRLESSLRPLGGVYSEFMGERSSAQRARAAHLLAGPLAEHAQHLLTARARADHVAAQLLAQAGAQRHPDAGPKEGVSRLAEAWLQDSKDLAQEAFQHARRLAEVEGESGLDTLWALLGTRYQGLFPRPGRYRRLAAELDPLGLRRQLARAARLGSEHADLFGATQVAPVAVPHDVRVLPPRAELGLASELSAADALGRAAGHVHASPALPLALRHASAATVARALGALTMLRFTEPLFLRKQRELNAREAGELARASAGFSLLETRLLAAAVLARGLVAADDAAERAQTLAERALLGPLPPGIALFLVTRLSPSAAFRGKVWAAGLVYALRERFDEDWYANPHAGEALRGAAARAGDFSVEAMAEELGARREDGLRKLSELF
jgi:hypothetical protein